MTDEAETFEEAVVTVAEIRTGFDLPDVPVDVVAGKRVRCVCSPECFGCWPPPRGQCVKGKIVESAPADGDFDVRVRQDYTGRVALVDRRYIVEDT